MTLVEFLKARLDEDEQLAQSCPYPSWIVSGPPVGHYAHSDTSDLLCAQIRADTWRNIAEPTMWSGQSLRHAAHHDPARVLREVKAKRRVLERHYDYLGSCGGHEDLVYSLAKCPELRDIAEIYADHPDYRSEWAP